MSDFWSRRRAAVEAEATAEVDAQAAREVESNRADLDAQSDDEVLAHFDLPDPDGCDDPAVLRKFLTETMPARLKSRALRRMWRLNPVLANLDGLVDYGEDFTDAATVVENMATTYQVGKGMLKALLHEPPAPPDVQDVDADEDDVPELIAQAEPAPARTLEDDDPTDDATPAPRRMRFQFDDSHA